VRIGLLSGLVEDNSNMRSTFCDKEKKCRGAQQQKPPAEVRCRCERHAESTPKDNVSCEAHGAIGHQQNDGARDELGRSPQHFCSKEGGFSGILAWQHEIMIAAPSGRYADYGRWLQSGTCRFLVSRRISHRDASSDCLPTSLRSEGPTRPGTSGQLVVEHPHAQVDGASGDRTGAVGRH
jgi:hypothetical protein